MKSGIYCIKNKLNNKLYVGSTINFDKRKREHYSYLRRGTHHSTYLQRSFNKYGEINFEFFILETCESEKLLIREQHYIDVLSPRYNICKIAGNSLGVKRSEETKKKLSDVHKGQKPWNKGVPQSEKQKNEHSLRMKGKISGVKGKKWKQESKEKLSKAKIGKPAKNKITIYQYDKNGKYINKFSSITEAEKTTKTKGIHQVLKGRCKTANNFIWSKEKTEYLPV